jgi:hypothetical protein
LGYSQVNLFVIIDELLQNLAAAEAHRSLAGGLYDIYDQTSLVPKSMP